MAEHIKQMILDRELSSVSAVYDAYIERVDQLGVMIDNGVDDYENLVSGEYQFYFSIQDGYKSCFDGSGKYKHDYYNGADRYSGLTYWYDMLNAAQEYVTSRSESGEDHITNWPIRDTVQEFYDRFQDLSSRYVNITLGYEDAELGVTERHDWSAEYGFVDISSVSLEDELKYGYDFMQTQIDQRRKFILDMFSDIKQQAADLRTLG